MRRTAGRTRGQVRWLEGVSIFISRATIWSSSPASSSPLGARGSNDPHEHMAIAAFLLATEVLAQALVRPVTAG